MTNKQPEPLIRADELEAIGAESSLARAMAAHTIRLLYKENEALRAALAQPEQEPTRSQKMRDAGITRRPKGWDKEQELEGINEVILNSIRDSSEVVAPPQREWQGLTDEEILEEYRQSYGDDGNLTDVYFAHAIEAKLKEKNT